MEPQHLTQAIARLEQQVERLIFMNKQLYQEKRKLLAQLERSSQLAEYDRNKQKEVSARLQKLLVRVQQLESSNET